MKGNLWGVLTTVTPSSSVWLLIMRRTATPMLQRIPKEIMKPILLRRAIVRRQLIPLQGVRLQCIHTPSTHVRCGLKKHQTSIYSTGLFGSSHSKLKMFWCIYKFWTTLHVSLILSDNMLANFCHSIVFLLDLEQSTQEKKAGRFRTVQLLDFHIGGIVFFCKKFSNNWHDRHESSSICEAWIRNGLV